jgi:valyl-tRNA synthetase
MNGKYSKLTDYISDKIANSEKDIENQNRELKFRIENFFHKYADNFINKIISDIKGCDISKVITEDTWNFSYQILGSDIKILNPVNPNVSFKVVKQFFKRCCEELSVELVKFDLAQQVDDKLEFVVYIKNPLNIINENDIYNFIKTL